MANNERVNQFADYVVETEDQGSGVHRQIVGAHLLSGGLSPTTASNTTVAQDTAEATSTEVLAEDATRKFVAIKNTHSTDTAFINFGAAATSSHLPILPGEWFRSSDLGVVPTQSIEAIRGSSNDITLVLVYA